jgi:peptidoglycan/xylan/chitin deacetylase (PgdA/CDA1 family)
MKKMLGLFTISVMFCLPSQALAKLEVPILVYHSIDEYNGSGSKELYVTPENFEKQMTYLKEEGYTLLSFERWHDINKVNKPIFITFDDGYKNNQNAFTIFQKLKDEYFNPSGTIFVISDFIGRPNRLSKSELREMTESGIFSIQSHSATHPDLTKIKDYIHELKDSKVKIETITGKPVVALAYPYGNFNEQVVSETKKYYRFGITTTPGAYVQKEIKNEKYLLPRIYITHSMTLKEFANAVHGKGK